MAEGLVKKAFEAGKKSILKTNSDRNLLKTVAGVGFVTCLAGAILTPLVNYNGSTINNIKKSTVPMAKYAGGALASYFVLSYISRREEEILANEDRRDHTEL